jgi:hypothetical protein
MNIDYFTGVVGIGNNTGTVNSDVQAWLGLAVEGLGFKESQAGL